MWQVSIQILFHFPNRKWQLLYVKNTIKPFNIATLYETKRQGYFNEGILYIQFREKTALKVLITGFLTEIWITITKLVLVYWVEINVIPMII